MSEIIELQELQKKKIGEEKKLPSWIYTDEKGNTKVNASNDVLDVTTKTSQNTGQSVDDLMKKAIDGAPQIKQLGG